MVFAVELDQSGTAHLGIDLRRGDVGVAKHRLHGAQVSPVLDEVGRKRVPQLMR